jgi:D-glutamate cyclase
MSEADPLNLIRMLIQEDAGNRGLRTDPRDNLITACPDDFGAACRSLAEPARASLAIVTGFFIAHGQPPAAETDGPLGALFLARTLTPVGFRVVLASDAFCISALEAGLEFAGLGNEVPLVTLPSVQDAAGMASSDYWRFVTGRVGELSHLIALERVGPCHTPESIRCHTNGDSTVLARFLKEVPQEHHDRCHSMRGRDITDYTSPAHRLFEEAPRATPRVRTIGIGDGGNEIGMGKVSWEVIRRNIPRGGLIACRVPTDHLVVCGISNWGAYGLAAGVRLLRGAARDPDCFDVERERALLERMVERGPLVDGMTGKPALAVDGLPFERYAQVLARLGAIR